MSTWDLMKDWHLVLPPSRPSFHQLSWIRRLATALDRTTPVAVLGSTPEFRDLLHELGFTNIYVLERNQRFFEEMSRVRIYSNEEKLVLGDWRETLPTLAGRFTLILSDLTSGNIPYEDRALFYGGIEAALCPSGMFVDKVLTHQSVLHSVEALVARYEERPLNLLFVNYFSCEMLFCSQLLSLEERVDSSRFYDELTERVKSQRVRAFIERAQKITPRGCTWWYGKSWSELSGDYCSNLVTMESLPDEPGSPYYGFLRFFALAQKD